MKILDYIFGVVVFLSLIVFTLYILAPKLFINWKYRRFLINIPIILTAGIAIAYSVIVNKRNREIKEEYHLLKQTTDTINIYQNDALKTPNKDSLKVLLDKENQLINNDKEISNLIIEKGKIDKRVGYDKALLDSLNQLQLRINDKLSKIKIEKTKYFTNDRKFVTHEGKLLKYNGRFVVADVKVFNCLYNIENLKVSSFHNEISSVNISNILINVKFTITENSGEIANKSIDSLMFLSFKLPRDNINNILSDSVRFDNLPSVDSVRFNLNISKMDTGTYYIDFFTKNCNICQFIFKLK
jgi:hypothetical protein